MAYKLLGFAVWQGARWYMRRRLHGVGRKAAVAAVGALVIGAAVAAQREAASQHQ